jgi:Protein of unknown function (DUF3775)
MMKDLATRNWKDKANRKEKWEASMKLSEALAKVIGLAKVIREYWETELPKRHPDYPFTNPGEQPVPPPPEVKKLAKLFASLPDEMVYQIGLLMDLGRGYFNVYELADSYKTLKEDFDSATDLASLLIDKATLAAYLQDGVAELEKHHIDVDKLPLKPARVRK